jgi:hypothetical protein
VKLYFLYIRDDRNMLGCAQGTILEASIPSANLKVTVLSGSLSPRHGTSSGCTWRNGLQLWKVAANTLNKQSRAADKGWSSSLGVGRGASSSM